MSKWIFIFLFAILAGKFFSLNISLLIIMCLMTRFFYLTEKAIVECLDSEDDDDDKGHLKFYIIQ